MYVCVLCKYRQWKTCEKIVGIVKYRYLCIMYDYIMYIAYMFVWFLLFLGENKTFYATHTHTHTPRKSQPHVNFFLFYETLHSDSQI